MINFVLALLALLFENSRYYGRHAETPLTFERQRVHTMEAIAARAERRHPTNPFPAAHRSVGTRQMQPGEITMDLFMPDMEPISMPLEVVSAA